MNELFVMLNIKEYLRYDKGGEELLRRIYFTFCCTKNNDIHKFLIMKNGELIQEGTEAELTEKVKGHVWKCIVSEKEAECLGQRFVVSNMRSNGENIELRVISEKQPMREAELLEGTLEDAYLYETQSAEET